ncbi:MAG: DUF4389 domain-containing protein [bacterium]
MDQDTKNRLADRSIWARGLYMLILVIAYSIGETLLAVIAVFQFLSALITGKVNESLQSFGANLSAYLYNILQFATFNSEDLPFPFSDWPDVEPGETPWSGKPDASATADPSVQTAASASSDTAPVPAKEPDSETDDTHEHASADAAQPAPASDSETDQPPTRPGGV